MTHWNIPIIVLAAGASSRMRGRDKLMETVDSQPLIRRQAILARAVTTGPVIIALPPKPHPRFETLEDLDVTPLPIPDVNEGINASLRTAIAALPANSTCAMVLLADMPDLTENDLKAMLRAMILQPNNLIWRATNHRGKHGHPIIFSANLFSAFPALQGDSGGRDILQAAKGQIAYVPLPDSDARADLDTPEDWAKWHALHSA